MFTVQRPETFNEIWARALNSRKIENLLALYEDDAILADATGVVRSKANIATILGNLMAIPGTMSSKNSFCLQHGDLALLRADWRMIAPDGTEAASGSTAEVIRRQPDGNWLYVIDHAAGASLPTVL